MSYTEQFAIGKLKLPNNIFYAPLAGCSDIAYRTMSSQYKPGLMFCEMVKMEPLVRKDEGTYRMLRYEEPMRPIGGQICGSKLELAGTAAKIIEDLGFDIIDFNCGCPVDKVTKDGSGSGMLKHPDLIGAILFEMKRAVQIPITVKIRTGWDEDHIVAPMLTQIAEQAGAAAICIHGRTREQGYSGNANWDYIAECKKLAKNIKVIGNGDVFDAEKAKALFLHTGCDAILVSRGTMGQPWIVEDIRNLYANNRLFSPSPLEVKEVLLKHLRTILSYNEERKSLLDFRRVCCYYLKKFVAVKTLKAAINHAENTEEVFSLLEAFNWEPCIGTIL